MKLQLFDKAPAALMRLNIEHFPLAVDLVICLELRTSLCMPYTMFITSGEKVFHNDAVDTCFLEFRPYSYQEKIQGVVLLE